MKRTKIPKTSKNFEAFARGLKRSVNRFLRKDSESVKSNQSDGPASTSTSVKPSQSIDRKRIQQSKKS
jgi:hypothetical protein